MECWTKIDILKVNFKREIKASAFTCREGVASMSLVVVEEKSSLLCSSPQWDPSCATIRNKWNAILWVFVNDNVRRSALVCEESEKSAREFPSNRLKVHPEGVLRKFECGCATPVLVDEHNQKDLICICESIFSIFCSDFSFNDGKTFSSSVFFLRQLTMTQRASTSKIEPGRISLCAPPQCIGDFDFLCSA